MKVVISGSASLQDKTEKWLNYFQDLNYLVIDYPRKIDENNFLKLYPDVHKKFFNAITDSNIFFLMNEDKNGIDGYIGAEAFAELCFAVSQNLVYDKNIDIYVLKMPNEKVQCYEEIKLWLSLGWVKIWSKYEFM